MTEPPPFSPASQASHLRMYQVDAFTNRLFSGNPAAVLVLDDWPEDALMQAIAQENNLAETAFTHKRPDGGWDLRWFTPLQEVDFCGHATLATAHVLFTRLGCAGRLTFQTRVGALHVAQEDGAYQLDLPRLPPDPLDALPPEAQSSFPTPPTQIFRNFENIFADLGSAAAVRAFRPNLPDLKHMGRMGLVVTGQAAEEDGVDFVSRYFAPGAGIDEDPVTGSIHATLVPYWAAKLGRDRLRAFQASARGGWIGCAQTADRVLLSGQAVTFMQAEIALPDAPFPQTKGTAP